MPIANCYLKTKMITQEQAGLLVKEWAAASHVKEEYITVNFIHDLQQAGKQYEVIVHLYLPTVWTKTETGELQLGLLNALAKVLKLKVEKIFIMTSLIQSGHVVEDGEIAHWTNNAIQ